MHVHVSGAGYSMSARALFIAFLVTVGVLEVKICPTFLADLISGLLVEIYMQRENAVF